MSRLPTAKPLRLAVWSARCSQPASSRRPALASVLAKQRWPTPCGPRVSCWRRTPGFAARAPPGQHQNVQPYLACRSWQTGVPAARCLNEGCVVVRIAAPSVFLHSLLRSLPSMIEKSKKRVSLQYAQAICMGSWTTLVGKTGAASCQWPSV